MAPAGLPSEIVSFYKDISLYINPAEKDLSLMITDTAIIPISHNQFSLHLSMYSPIPISLLQIKLPEMSVDPHLLTALIAPPCSPGPSQEPSSTNPATTSPLEVSPQAFHSEAPNQPPHVEPESPINLRHFTWINKPPQWQTSGDYNSVLSISLYHTPYDTDLRGDREYEYGFIGRVWSTFIIFVSCTCQ